MRLSQYLPEAILGPAAVLYSLVPGNLLRRLFANGTADMIVSAESMLMQTSRAQQKDLEDLAKDHEDMAAAAK